MGGHNSEGPLYFVCEYYGTWKYLKLEKFPKTHVSISVKKHVDIFSIGFFKIFKLHNFVVETMVVQENALP